MFFGDYRKRGRKLVIAMSFVMIEKLRLVPTFMGLMMYLLQRSPMSYFVLFYFILLYFYFILFYIILFYSILFGCVDNFTTTMVIASKHPQNW